MASVHTTTTLAGLFKEVYGTSVIDLCKAQAKISSRIPFEEKTLIGSHYNIPVVLSQEHGFAYAAAGTTPSTPTVVTALMGNAQVDGSQLFGATVVDYEAIAKSLGGDKKAFIQATKQAVKTLSNAAVKRLEIQLLHGRRGIGLLNADPGTGTTFVISEASWSPGIWSGMVGASVQMYQVSDYTTARSGGPYTVSSVDMSTRTVTVGAALDASIASGDAVFFYGATGATEFAGIDKLSRNTGSLFGIDAAVYEGWGGNIYSTSTGTLSMSKILEAIGMTASYGADKDVVCVVSPKAFEVLNADQAALRQYDSSYDPKSAKSGAQSLKFHSQVGACEILSHPYQKDGMAHIFCPDEMLRVGATDLTFIKRHGTDEVLILETAATASAQMRVYSHQALFCERPRTMAVLDGITY